jgi:ABC-type branched-subunit amino acid transport system substrate-binding protein
MKLLSPSNFFLNKSWYKLIGHVAVLGWLILNCQPATSISLKVSQFPADTLVIGILVEQQQGTTGANIAAHFALKQISPNNLIVKFKIKSVEGPWGITSNRTVSLLYDEKAEIIIGALSGRNAHLVEQIAAKWQIPYLETLATDPSLSKAYVPNFFRLNFSDDQISKSLIERIKVNQTNSNAILILEDHYDSQQALDAFTKQYARAFEKDPLILLMGNDVEENNLAVQLALSKNEGNIILLQNQYPLPSLNLDLKVIANNSNPVYAWRTTESSVFSSKTKLNQLKNNEQNNELNSLKKHFIERLQRNPRPYEVRLVDAINCALSAYKIRPNQSAQQLSKQIKENTNINGLSGTIRFDDFGNVMRAVTWE